MSTALPHPASEQDISHPDIVGAYDVCLRFETHAINACESQDLIHARVLGYLILHAPTLIACHEVVRVICSCSEDYSLLSELGKTFVDYFIRPFKKHKARTPTPSTHPSRPSFDHTRVQLLATIAEAPKDHTEAKRKALIRDGYRCAVTGKYDKRAFGVAKEQLEAAGTVYTGCAHIVPDSTYFNILGNPPHKREYFASVLTVLKRFGYDVDQLNGKKIHSLFNVMTMQYDVHDWFDRLEMWFERTATPNCYNVKAIMTLYMRPRSVTFTTPDPTILPLPSPELLALHAACAKVAHLSGAGEYVDRVLEDMEEVGVLAHDGSSSNLLYHAILAGATRAIPTGV